MPRDPIIRDRDPEADYELIGVLGEGSYGVVWKARDRATDETVAIKIVPFDDGDDSELCKEIEILERSRDDFVVGYYRSYEKDQTVWMAMQLAEAGSVNDLIHICDVALEEGLIKVLVASALLGLQYLHEAKMIHRDIKAGNLLLTKTGHAVLADFGVSARLSTLVSKRNTVIGTPFWMAPEVIQESMYDSKADLWSLGITLIELADREPPFSNIHPMRAIFMIPSRPPPTFHDESRWSPDMVSFSKRCLVKNPDERASAKELLDHPFVRDEVAKLNAATPRGYSPVIKNLVDSCIDEIEQFRIDEANRQSDVGGNTIKSGHANAAAAALNAKDSVSATLVKPSSATLIATGTLVNDDTMRTAAATLVRDGTLQTSQMAGTAEPDFMSYFKTAVSVQTGGLDKPEAEALVKSLSRLDQQFKSDFFELKKQYEKRKVALLAAAGAKP
jgi:serine/threonine protein kinase